MSRDDPYLGILSVEPPRSMACIPLLDELPEQRLWLWLCGMVATVLMILVIGLVAPKRDNPPAPRSTAETADCSTWTDFAHVSADRALVCDSMELGRTLAAGMLPP